MLLGGCSLSGTVQQSALDYSVVMEEFTNQALVRNVLRARDYAPLNFSDLPLIHGALATQLTLGATTPYKNIGSTASTTSPSVQFTSQPTFDTASLNTQGFTLNLIQPISPIFVYNNWSASIPKELLLFLFIDSVQLSTTKTILSNNPESEDDMKNFKTLVETLMKADVNLKSFTLLDPIGLPMVVDTSGNDEGGRIWRVDTDKGSTIKDLMGVVAQTDETQLRFGNVSYPVKGSNGDKNKSTVFSGFQLYRKYAGQVAVCIDDEKFAKEVDKDANSKSWNLHFETDVSDFRAASALSTAQKSGDGGGKGGKGGPQSPSSGAAQGVGSTKQSLGTSNAIVSLALQVNRISPILKVKSECDADEKILPRESQEDIVKKSNQFAHIKWRSIDGIFRYLGALTRRNESISWTPFNGAGEKIAGTTHTLFFVQKDARKAGRISVDYRGHTYSVQDSITSRKNSRNEVVMNHDHTLQVLSLLSQLVNTAKISGDIPVTRTLEIVP
jgi:hypothetical protein